MPLLKPAQPEQAFLKAGLQGFAGSGKTFTATTLAIGLHKLIQSKKPVGWLDSETGSDYVLHRFKAEKIELIRHKSRAFVDLVNVCREAEKLCDIVIIDSVTHFWTELVSSFQKARKLDHLTLRHWQPIKQEWAQFSELFINSRLHIIMCGRAGWEYDYQEDEEGVKELVKTGTRMKTEGETAYEPGLLIEMEKVRKEQGKIGGSFVRRAWILKDRFNLIDGRAFDNPTFEDFLPHIKMLNLGGSHVGLEPDRSSAGLFDSPQSRSKEFKLREIHMENIQAEMTLRWPGQSTAEKKRKVEVLKEIFGTGSWTALAEMTADVLEKGLQKLKAMPVTPTTGEKEPPNA